MGRTLANQVSARLNMVISTIKSRLYDQYHRRFPQFNKVSYGYADNNVTCAYRLLYIAMPTMDQDHPNALAEGEDQPNAHAEGQDLPNARHAEGQDQPNAHA